MTRLRKTKHGGTRVYHSTSNPGVEVPRGPHGLSAGVVLVYNGQRFQITRVNSHGTCDAVCRSGGGHHPIGESMTFTWDYARSLVAGTQVITPAEVADLQRRLLPERAESTLAEWTKANA